MTIPAVAAVSAVNPATIPLMRAPPGINSVNATPAAVAALDRPSMLSLKAAAPFLPSSMALPAAIPALAKCPTASAAVPDALVKFFMPVDA